MANRGRLGISRGKHTERLCEACVLIRPRAAIVQRLWRSVIEAAAREIGGVQRLVEWVREDPLNERLFWSSMWIKLLPVQVHGSGPHGELEMALQISPEDLSRRLEERGLPALVFGCDKPVVQVEGNGADLDAEQSNGNQDRVPAA